MQPAKGLSVSITCRTSRYSSDARVGQAQRIPTGRPNHRAEPGRNSLKPRDYMQTLDVPFQVRPARSHASCDVYCAPPEDGACWVAHPPTNPKRTRARATTLMRVPPLGASSHPHNRDHCRPLDADLRRLGTRKCESLSVDVRDVAIAELLSRMPGIDHIVGAMAQRGYKSEFEANATL